MNLNQINKTQTGVNWGKRRSNICCGGLGKAGKN